MRFRLVYREIRGVFLVALAMALPGCGDDSNPIEPVAPATSAMFGNWIGTLSGPSARQPSGWPADTRDSLWVVFSESGMDFQLLPAAGAAVSVSPAGSTCFERYPSALNSIADPSVSFRVNLSSAPGLASAVPFVGTRSADTLRGTVTIPGDTLASHWTAVRCATCPGASVTTSIEPDTRPALAQEFTLKVNGSGFTSCSVVRVNDEDRITTFVSANQLTVKVTPNDQAVAGFVAITVFTPTAGGGVSNVQTLTISSP